MLIAQVVPASRLRWILASMMVGNAFAWCGSCRRVRSADLVCASCGAETEPITLPNARGALDQLA